MTTAGEELRIGQMPMTWHTVSTGNEGGPGWSHSGVAALPDGSIVLAHPEGGRLIVLDRLGESRLVPTPLTELHGLAVAVDHDGTPLVWVADNGHRFVYDVPAYGEVKAPGRVVALSPAGQVRRELDCPSDWSPWSPTSIAVVNDRDPASDVWVADGYGRNLVHRFDARGTAVTTLDGLDTGLAFACPHGITIRARDQELAPELYVADRANRRLVVYSLSGELSRIVGEGVLNSPSSIAAYGRHLLVTELLGSIAVFDGDEYVGHIGACRRAPEESGWPNRLDEDGNHVAPQLVDGSFNSPHGIIVANDSVYVTEWLIGGRLVRLDPVVSTSLESGS